MRPLRRRPDARSCPPRRGARGRHRPAAGVVMTSTLCVIPARGGSKGIPRKNLADCAGRPLIAWTIEQALAVARDSTSSSRPRTPRSPQVAARPRRRGHRAAAGARRGHHRHRARRRARHRGADSGRRAARPGDAAPGHLPRTPPRQPGPRAGGVRRATGADSLVGVVPQAPFLWWATDPPTADYDVAARPRRQDLTPDRLRYRETGSLYVTRTEVYLQQHNRLGGRDPPVRHGRGRGGRHRHTPTSKWRAHLLALP